jgi:hypothetical protein
MKLHNRFNRLRSYIVEALRYGGKKMLCDIMKWTIIIIIAAIVFGITYRIVTKDLPHRREQALRGKFVR